MGKKAAGLGFAILMLVSGGLWTLQGLGWLDDTPASGARTLATLGPLVAGFGLALGYVSLRGRR